MHRQESVQRISFRGRVRQDACFLLDSLVNRREEECLRRVRQDVPIIGCRLWVGQRRRLNKHIENWIVTHMALRKVGGKSHKHWSKCLQMALWCYLREWPADCNQLVVLRSLRAREVPLYGKRCIQKMVHPVGKGSEVAKLIEVVRIYGRPAMAIEGVRPLREEWPNEFWRKDAHLLSAPKQFLAATCIWEYANGCHGKNRVVACGIEFQGEQADSLSFRSWRLNRSSLKTSSHRSLKF